MKKILLPFLGITLFISFIFFSHPDTKAGKEIIFQDDFETDLSRWQITAISPNSASISTGKVQSGQRSLKLHYTDGSSAVVVKREFSSPQNGIVSVWFYDSLRNPSGSGVAISNADNTQTVSVGVHPNYSNNYYYRASLNKPWMNINSKVRRTQGWHKFELISTPRGSYAKIDGVSLSWLPAEKKFGDGKEWNSTAVNTDLRGFSQIQIFATWGALDDYFYDLVKVHSLPSPPATNLEKEYNFVRLFLRSYQNTNLSSLITAYPSDSHTYRGLLYTALAHAVRFRKEGGQTDLARAESLINQVVDGYHYWGKTWQSTVITYNMGLTAWLLWPYLNQEIKMKVKEKMVTDANFWLPSTDWPANRYIGNSAGEENAWFASGFALTALMFPNEPNASAWEAKAKKLAFHSLTTNETYEVDGSRTQTLYSDYRLENHDIRPHPHYAIGTVGLLGEGALAYFKTGREVPWEFKHNVTPVTNKALGYINLNTFQIDFINIEGASCLLPFLRVAGKDDWMADATWFSQDAFVFLLNQSLLPEANSLYQNLLDYEVMIAPDFNAFPVPENAVINNVNLGAPIDCSGGYKELTDGYKWFMNGLVTMRHIIALLYQDSTLTLPTTFSSFSLSPGWNKTTWPNITSYTAKYALEDIDNDCGIETAIAISRKRKDWWEGFIKNYGGRHFNLQNNQSYFINVAKSCSWAP